MDQIPMARVPGVFQNLLSEQCRIEAMLSYGRWAETAHLVPLVEQLLTELDQTLDRVAELSMERRHG